MEKITLGQAVDFIDGLAQRDFLSDFSLIVAGAPEPIARIRR